MALAVHVAVSSAWVSTDIKYYASRQDVIDYMEKLYPKKLDTKKNRYIQNYDIDTLRNGDHRIWAERKLRDDEIEFLEDVNNFNNKTFD